MKLIKLTLTNFMGIKHFELNTGGRNATVYGENGVGKTTLFSAFLWLLFDKDSQNKKDFAIKTLDASGNVLHGLDHEVEAILEIDGKPLEIKKVYRENWVKQRGSAEKTFSGHTTDYFVNGVPVKKTEYAVRIASIIDEDIFKLLTNPAYFNTQLKWEERRRILLEVCGDMTDTEVIALNKDLEKLTEILGDRSMDDHRKVIAASRKKINDELQKIPVRIDEMERMLPGVNGLDQAALAIERGQLDKQLDEKQAEISRIKNGQEVAEKTKQLREMEAQLLDIKNKHRAAVDEQVSAKRAELSILQSKFHAVRQEVLNAENDRDRNRDRITDLEKKITELRSDWHEANGKEFKCEQSNACPVCGQAFPAEYVESVREKALAEFNKAKAERLEAITGGGKLHRETINKLKDENEKLTETVVEKQIEMDDAKTLIEKLQAEIDSITASASDPTESPEYKKILTAKDKLDSEISDLQMGTRELLTMAQEEADTIKEQIQAVDDDLQKLRMREQGEARIKELAAEEKKLAAEYEKLEHQQYLMDEFLKTKVNAMEERINSKFKMARFKLFDVQINGGISETCQTLINGVPYESGLNRAAQINAGLDIISTLSEHYDFTAPIFIDNREAVTDLIETKAQVINLVVSRGDKKLRVEIESGQNTLFGEEN